MLKQFLVIIFLLFVLLGNAQTLTWVDSMDNYAREAYLPATQYQWTWQNAALLKVMVNEYETATPERKSIYFDYIKRAMDKNKGVANGRKPNNVASGLGMAFLYKIS